MAKLGRGLLVRGHAPPCPAPLCIRHSGRAVKMGIDQRGTGECVQNTHTSERRVYRWRCIPRTYCSKPL